MLLPLRKKEYKMPDKSYIPTKGIYLQKLPPSVDFIEEPVI